MDSPKILLTAQFYDKPDGEDFAGKMIASNRFILAGAIPFATADVLMYSHPKGYLATLGCFAKWIGPAMGLATAFTTATYAAQHLRGKDDALNYAFGGIAAGGVFGKVLRHPGVGIQACFIFALAGMIKKVSLQEGWTFFPSEEQWEKTRQYGTLRTTKYDWTIIKDQQEKGWTTGKN